jgi:hypothetical protein
MSVINYPKLMKARAISNYMIELEFNNKEKRIYDFKPNLAHLYYKELANPVLFKNISVTDGEIEWATGQDFCPHTLYNESVSVTQ